MLDLDQLTHALRSYREGLCKEIDAAGLISRNDTAHKWKVTYRTIVLRELVSWRFVDLLSQALILEKLGKHVGSRILIRASIETLAMMLYTIRKMESIVRTGDGFHQYSDKTTRLLIGSRNEHTKYEAISILDILQVASKKHPELQRAYDELSETAHPNWDGLSRMYSEVSEKGMVTSFTDDTGRIYKKSQLPTVALLCSVFEIEYNDAWSAAFDDFENWIEKNDKKLEREL